MTRCCFLCLVGYLLINFYCGCSNSSHNSKEQGLTDATTKANPIIIKKNFDSLMLVDKNIQLEFYEELLEDKAFVDILEHSNLYFKDAMALLSVGHFTPAQAEICICAMQNLSVNDYVKFCKLYMSLYKRGKLSEQIIEDVISPDFLKKRIIIYNYDNPDVKALLESIRDDKTFPNKDFKKYIQNDILSGKAEKDLKAFDQGNE
jgi:hypothetical protein